MDFASSLLGFVRELWGCASKSSGNIYNLKENAEAFKTAAEDLKAKREDVTSSVECGERGGGAHRTREVENWLGKVQEFEDRVHDVLEEDGERNQIKCLGRFLPHNCLSSYKLGKRVDRLLNEARELQRREFGNFTFPLPPPPLDLEIPTGKTVGLDDSLDEVWKWLVEEKEVEVIGLYGTGGVGKTTLMKRINKKLSNTNHGFEVVIWVVVSRQVNEDGIRDVIRKRLNIEDESWDRWSLNDRVRHLLEELTQKKFVLLIDDVWEWLDLSKIGVPILDLKNVSKVVFTTREKQVCQQMRADRTWEVKCLMAEEALELFEDNVGKPTLHSNPEIPELAKEVVKECKGLPLVVITVGRAMAGIDKPLQWKHALAKLKRNPYRVEGMEKGVYYILKLSYDKLNDSSLQSCFLYCCLFPEDYCIRRHELIGLWIGERLLRNDNDVYSLRNEGEYVLDRLNKACLLEIRDDTDGGYVKMHDVIRDMAIWIARDRGKKENNLLVVENEEDIFEEKISKWREAKKVSLWGQQIGNIDRTPPRHSRVETLFVRETKVMSLPRGFFESMKARLMVLDLSKIMNMTSFPEEICKLINLRYLNLSRTTGIRELPKKIKNLTHLRWLLLDDMDSSLLISTGAIASLPLVAFSYWHSSTHIIREPLEKEEEMVKELGRMQHLTDLSISVFKSSSALNIFRSPNLRRCLRRVRINISVGLTNIEISGDSPGSGGSFLHLEELHLWDCGELRKMEVARGVG